MRGIEASSEKKKPASWPDALLRRLGRELSSRHPFLATCALLALIVATAIFHRLEAHHDGISFGMLLAIAILVVVFNGWLLDARRELTRIRFEFELILNNTALRILYKDDQNRILRLNKVAAQFLGRSVTEIAGKSGYDLFPKYAKARHEEDLAVIRSGRSHLGEIKEMGTIGGVTQWGRIDKVPYVDPITGGNRILAVATDLTEQINAEIALRQSEQRYNLAIEMSDIGTWDWDIQTSAGYWSPRMKEIVGLPADAEITSFLELESRLHPDDRDAVLAARRAHFERGGPYLVEYRLRHESGSYVWIRVRGQAVWNEAGEPVRMAGSAEDITERVCLQQRLAHLAHHDGLTGLLNRVMFRERLAEGLQRVGQGLEFALVCVDLDGFKTVNDTYGHAAGDKILKAVGKRLRRCAGEADAVARLGGDEFAIIHHSSDVRRTAGDLGARIVEAVEAPVEIEGTQATVGASVGMALAPRDGSEADLLMQRADVALYCAKQEGRGASRLFEPEMETDIRERRELAEDLRKALANRDLDLHYQPLVNVSTGEITGFEALIRWHHPERGLVPPVEFIPVAEECGLINQIGEWVLVQACCEASGWPADLNIAVNVSPVQFRGGLLMLVVAQALSKSGLRANRLELEITESVLLEDDESSLAILRQLHELGVRISLDDFGTGYSSLSYLQRFPFDKIKIDASFIAQVGDDVGDIGIVHAVVGLANRLGVATTAEGVETQGQLDVIRAEGCTEMQGFLFSPPRPADEIADLFFGNGRRGSFAAALTA